jgi:hypothetical protein
MHISSITPTPHSDRPVFPEACLIVAILVLSYLNAAAWLASY